MALRHGEGDGADVAALNGGSASSLGLRWARVQEGTPHIELIPQDAARPDPGAQNVVMTILAAGGHKMPNQGEAVG